MTTDVAAAPSPPRSNTMRWQRWALGVLAVIVVAIGVCEALGWPFLAAPMQRWLGQTLERRVSLSAAPGSPPQATIHLLGGIRLRAGHIEIGAPAWSREPYMMSADDARLTLGYFDLWRASRGEPLRIRVLSAARLDARLERQADGRASWQFGKKSDEPDTATTPTRIPVFGRLQVDAGTMTYRDALMVVDLDATYSLVEGSNVPAADLSGASGAAGRATNVAAGSATAGASSGSASASAVAGSASGSAVAGAGPASAPVGLQFAAKGTYQKQPLRIDLRTDGVLPVIADEAATLALPVVLDARIGGARMTFNGTATDALHLTALKGRFSVQGPSLAAAGEPLHVTLPTTGPFKAQGLIVKDGLVWKTVVDAATIGSSQLAGAFTYDPRPTRPVLSGRLTGSRLLLADLGPAVGTGAAKPAAAAAGASATPTTAAKRGGRVLPDRDFDLPSLRAMDANVLVDIASLDVGSGFLEPLRPLRTHLVLADGVLTLREIDARTGQGRLSGSLQLDGRKAQALWTADLRVAGVRLESWIRQKRGEGSPPYLTGRLAAQARVAGQGRSTADILASLRGGVRLQLAGATISHLAVEAIGIDIAQGLGMLIKGDDSLPVNCGLADFNVDKGVLAPRVFVLDTPDSTVLIDGSVSLATEALDLRVVTSPKDFSPLALRTPVRLRGTLGDPAVSLEPGPLAARVGAAALLALVTPLAAILPLMDTGNDDDAKRAAESCRALTKRIASRPGLAAPAPARSATRPVAR